MKRMFLVLLAVLICFPAFAVKPITKEGIHQGDLVEALRLIANLNGTRVLSDPDLHEHAAGGPTFDFGNSFSYMIGGALYSKAAADEIADVSAAAQATGTACFYLLSLNSSGTLAATKGTAVTIGSTPAMPAVPASSVAVGALRVDINADAAAGFTLGTTNFNWATASSTVTLYRFDSNPDDLDALEALLDY